MVHFTLKNNYVVIILQFNILIPMWAYNIALIWMYVLIHLYFMQFKNNQYQDEILFKIIYNPYGADQNT